MSDTGSYEPRVWVHFTKVHYNRIGGEIVSILVSSDPSFIIITLLLHVSFLQDLAEINVRENRRAIKNGQSRDTFSIVYTVRCPISMLNVIMYITTIY
jgi:hypothetical protein